MAVPIDNQSRFVAFISIFSALGVVLDSIPMIPGFYSGVWDSWLFLMTPLYGILLGPSIGAISIAMSSLLGHLIYFRGPFEFVFMFGAPLGAAVSGLIFQKKWPLVCTIYSLLLLCYFATPVSWLLPLWGIWDVLFGFVFLLIFSVISGSKILQIARNNEFILALLFAVIIGLETDILFRIFVLVPGQTYWFFYGLTVEGLQAIWMGAGFVTPVKVIIAALIAVVVGSTLLRVLDHSKIGKSSSNLQSFPGA